ncbi:hypothetical protein AB4156_43705, partial [Cupriavidus sp. 2MCAB6]|uniref:hypothetical protein n=1 Tax=Cupriavidus sp. 2MCAB6 TaxID=3232981 RepID=UPI003F8DFF3B
AREIAQQVLELSRAGLARRARLNGKGEDETSFLDPVLAIAESGRSLAQDLADRYRGEWNERVEPVFKDLLI